MILENYQKKILDITKPSILIVEDSKDVRLYLTDLLNQEYILYEASNGKEGIIFAQGKNSQFNNKRCDDA